MKDFIEKTEELIEKVHNFFDATRRFPGAGVYIGFCAYAGFKPQASRYGLIINLGFMQIMFITYDFMASSKSVYSDYLKLRNKIDELQHMYANRVPRKQRNIISGRVK